MERFTKMGKIATKTALDVKKTPFGIGFEKLDRDVFDPEKAYDKISKVGAKWVRLQSGWQRTEKEEGVYDFAWLDTIVDNLIERGMTPWLCLCYGNGLYDDFAKEIFGAAGCPPIYDDRQRTAWKNYVAATVKHFKGRIEYYEVWNEPDGIWCWKKGINATELGEFTVATADAIRSADSCAKVIGGVVWDRRLGYICEALATGMGKKIDAISFHEYTPNEQRVYERVESLRALGRMYNPDMQIIQGESGSQSKSTGQGALRGGAWTEKKQAKQLLRHALADVKSRVMFSSYFSCMDMIEALNGKAGDVASYLDYGYFGLLSADFDENGFSTGEYTPKMSYYAYQNLCAMICDDFAVAELPVLITPAGNSRRNQGPDFTKSNIDTVGIRKPNGSSAYFYWYTSDIMTTEVEGTTSLEIYDPTGTVKLIDVMDGSVYPIPEDMIENLPGGCRKINFLPVKDYPMALVCGDFVEIEEVK